MSKSEEDKLDNHVRRCRAEGIVVDAECLVLLGNEVMKRARGPDARLPHLGHNWVRSYRKRWGMTRLQRGTSDRTADSPQDVQKDNEWRQRYEDFIQNPTQYGVAARQAVSPHLQFAVDETPLPYFPRLKGTYNVGKQRRTPIAFSSDKRQITGTPCFTRSGSLPVFQLIWRGLSGKCEGKPVPGL